MEMHKIKAELARSADCFVRNYYFCTAKNYNNFAKYDSMNQDLNTSQTHSNAIEAPKSEITPPVSDFSILMRYAASQLSLL